MGCGNTVPNSEEAADSGGGKGQQGGEKGGTRPDGHIKLNFKVGKVLGKGGSCKVVEATPLAGSSAVARLGKDMKALKIMAKKDRVNLDLYKKELEILNKVRHPHIVLLEDYWQDSASFYIITKLCSGGELFDRIVDKKIVITEKHAAKWIGSLMDALDTCHKMQIVHRDLKPENLIFENPDMNAPMILIDFGCAKEVIDDKEYKDLVGTPYYLAPESAAGHKYIRTGFILKESDLWSVGIITYVMMTGRPPFNGSSNTEIFSNIIKKTLEWPNKAKLSDPLKNFITKLLKKSPKKRIKMDEVLKHPWLNGGASNEKISTDVIKVLKQFQKQSKLKKAISKTLAKHMGDEPLSKIKAEFKKLDKDGNNKLDESELAILLGNSGMAKAEAIEQAKDIIKSVDIDMNGTIEFEEFATIWQRKLLSVNNAYIKAVFNVLDADNSGQISRGELLAVLAPEDQALVDEIIADVDTDKDGFIDEKEFTQAMKETNNNGGVGNAQIDGSDVKGQELKDEQKDP